MLPELRPFQAEQVGQQFGLQHGAEPFRFDLEFAVIAKIDAVEKAPRATDVDPRRGCIRRPQADHFRPHGYGAARTRLQLAAKLAERRPQGQAARRCDDGAALVAAGDRAADVGDVVVVEVATIADERTAEYHARATAARKDGTNLDDVRLVGNNDSEQQPHDHITSSPRRSNKGARFPPM